jgi:hypothetical protein
MCIFFKIHVETSRQAPNPDLCKTNEGSELEAPQAYGSGSDSRFGTLHLSKAQHNTISKIKKHFSS